MKDILYRCRHCFCALFLLICTVNLSIGESLDQVINPQKARNEWVSDMAGVIDNESESSLNTLIDQLEQKTTAEVAVVTIQRTDGHTPKEFATELFNRWGVGKKDRDNGVLVLLVMEARRIEVETGYGMEGLLPDGKVGEILDVYVIPRFKEGDFSGGILAGVQAMAEVIMKEEPETVSPQPAVSPKTSPSQETPVSPVFVPSERPWTTWLLARLYGFLAVILPLTLIVYGVWRFRTRYCKQCGKRMRRLTEEQDDAYLSFAQKVEEKLGSVNYRVWRCDDCQTCKIERSILSLSSYENCPQCKHRTVHVKSHTLEEPTYSRTGLEQVIRICRFPECTYHRSSQRSIPRLVRPAYSSSGWLSGSSFRGGSFGSGSFRGGGSFGGGSFGGGSSGGGGAGRSW